MKLNEKIYILRRARGFSQEQLGLSLSTKDNGVSRQTVSDWEKGKSEPKLDNIRALADLLNVSYDVLLDEELDLNNPEYLSAVLSGTYNSGDKLLSNENYFIYKRSYGLLIILLLLIVVGVCLPLILIGIKNYQIFFAQAKARSGDASIMGQNLNNRATMYLLMAIFGGSLLLVISPFVIYRYIKEIRSNKSIGVINNEELVLYPNPFSNPNKTTHIKFLDIKDVSKSFLSAISITKNDGDKLTLRNIKYRREVFEKLTKHINK